MKVDTLRDDYERILDRTIHYIYNYLQGLLSTMNHGWRSEKWMAMSNKFQFIVKKLVHIFENEHPLI